jgi:hypothetical protein
VVQILVPQGPELGMKAKKKEEEGNMKQQLFKRSFLISSDIIKEGARRSVVG